MRSRTPILRAITLSLIAIVVAAPGVRPWRIAVVAHAASVHVHAHGEDPSGHGLGEHGHGEHGHGERGHGMRSNANHGHSHGDEPHPLTAHGRGAHTHEHQHGPIAHTHEHVHGSSEDGAQSTSECADLTADDAERLRTSSGNTCGDPELEAIFRSSGANPIVEWQEARHDKPPRAGLAPPHLESHTTIVLQR